MQKTDFNTEHLFRYTVKNSITEDATPHEIEFRMSGHMSLPEILEKFEAYLKAVGYNLNGIVDIVSDDENVKPVNDWKFYTKKK